MLQTNFIYVKKYASLLNKFLLFIPIVILASLPFTNLLLKIPFANLIIMHPGSAVLFLLCGISLYFVTEKNTRYQLRIGKFMGGAIALVAAVRLTAYYFIPDTGITELLFGNSSTGNWMDANTTMNFILTGVSLVFVNSKKKSGIIPSQFIALLVFLAGLLAVIGHVYAIGTLYSLAGYDPMPLSTAGIFLLLSTGILLCHYQDGFVGVIMFRNVGGSILRKFLPVAVIIPILGVLLILQGERLGMYHYELGSSLGTILMISISAVSIWSIARSLNNNEEKRKNIEQQLNNAKIDLAVKEINYKNLIENSGIVMYTTSLNGTIIFANTKAIQLTGYTTRELTGMHFSKMLHTEVVEELMTQYKKQVKSNVKETHSEFRICTKHGEIKWVEQTAVLITEDDFPVGFQCVVKDISEKKKMEAVLQKYEAELLLNEGRLQSILDNATSLMYIKDLDGKYLLTNKKLKEYLNLTDETIIGKTDYDITDAEQAQRFKDTDDQVIKTGKSVELEDSIERPDGTHNMLIIKFPLVDAQNNVYGISGIATDITERVKFQQQLILSNKIAIDAKKMQEQFLANMSHEIRTPMNGIQGMTDLLLQTKLNDEQEDFVKTIKISSDNLLIIINDILDFSKIKAGKLNIEKISFNLKEVLKNIQGIFIHKLKEKELQLNISIDEDIPATLKGDPYRLNQILVNLVGNAIKFTDEGIINISIAQQNKNTTEMVLKFTISDTGIGIEIEKLSEIFESFSQANIETSRKYGGTGLGLAITRQLIEIQNGSISVQSEINKGTTFIFTIPYHIGTASDAIFLENKKAVDYRSLLAGKKFLVVEDNEVNQKVIGYVLQNAGGSVDIASNGLEAISLLNNSSDYNLIIMDLRMPVMDGYATTKYIRKGMKLSIPIVAMTASALKSEKTKCIEYGMNDYITKPFDYQILYKRLSLLLQNLPVTDFIMPAQNDEHDSLYNLSLLEEMDDQEYIFEILTLFVTNTPNELFELEKACTSGQYGTAFKIAHKLKSSAGLLRADEFLKILTEIEEEAKKENSDALYRLAIFANEAHKKIESPLLQHLKMIQEKSGCLIK